MKPTIVKLDNPIQHYAWGSRTAIAELQGRPAPSREPEAEVWIGDHPVAPSRVLPVNGGAPIALAEWIADAPEATLGADRAHGDHLPFLTKILAAGRPLSLQVHPDEEQARRGFAREQAARTGADTRSYRDPYAKHEMLIALSAFHALCGFRANDDVARQVARAASPRLQALYDEVAPAAKAGPEAPSAASLLLERLHEQGASERRALCAELAAGAAGPTEAAAPSSEAKDTRYWIARLCAEHPDDALAAAPVLMNCISLAPGEALVVAPGTLHTYLDGLGVEVMTPSDNVVRAGLSPKHVDVAEFRRIASTRAAPAQCVEPVGTPDCADQRYPTATPRFSVSSISLGDDQPRRSKRDGGRVAVLLCVAGEIEVRTGAMPAVVLRSGEAAIVPASTEQYVVEAAATARVFVVEGGGAQRPLDDGRA